MTSSAPLPFSPAADNNKDPILRILCHAFSDVNHVLEIGSGTGQHAAFLGQHLPHLTWQPSDLPVHLDAIRARLATDGADNVRDPVAIDVAETKWPVGSVDGIFSANVIHIIGWPLVVSMFDGIGSVLKMGGTLCFYGPFKYGGQYTSDSNEQFDGWLKDRDSRSGIRDFEAVNELALANGLALAQDHAMPANNQLIVWRSA